jgi:excinuclease ABC subunit B
MTYTNLADYLQVSRVQKARPLPAFLDHLYSKLDEHIAKKWRTLILTLTKKSAEEISSFLIGRWYKAYYLHSEVSTIDRWEIIKKLRSGSIDILVWINLLREGIDLPEVSLITILDADKEGFLRSTTSLIQIIWRAARNPDSEVILYADQRTESMIKALWETYRRRSIQMHFNTAHGITPSVAISNIKSLDVVRTDDDLWQDFQLLTRWKVKRLKRLTKREKEIIMKDLKWQLDEAIVKWEFEKAAGIRDQIKELEESSYKKEKEEVNYDDMMDE